MWGWDIPAQRWIFLINTVILTFLRVIPVLGLIMLGSGEEKGGNIPLIPRIKCKTWL